MVARLPPAAHGQHWIGSGSTDEAANFRVCHGLRCVSSTRTRRWHTGYTPAQLDSRSRGVSMTFRSRRSIVGMVTVLSVFVLGTVLARGQAAPAGQAPRVQMAEEVFKNVQLLKGIPVDEFMDTMGMFAAALSLNCVDCHTSESVGSWDHFADETPLKRTSRRMIQMVNAINKDNFGGARILTCYSCHRGDLRPKAVPNLAAQYAEHVDDANEVLINRIPGGPTVDQVLAKYTQALGGAAKLAAVTSVVGKG